MELIFLGLITIFVVAVILVYHWGYGHGYDDASFREKHRGSGMIDSAGLPL